MNCLPYAQKHFIPFVIFLLTISPLAADTHTQQASLQECAIRDARFALLLEQHGDRGDVPGDKLYAAFLTMLRARSACSAGRTNEGLALYDSVFGSETILNIK